MTAGASLEGGAPAVGIAGWAVRLRFPNANRKLLLKAVKHNVMRKGRTKTWTFGILRRRPPSGAIARCAALRLERAFCLSPKAARNSAHRPHKAKQHRGVHKVRGEWARQGIRCCEPSLSLHPPPPRRDTCLRCGKVRGEAPEPQQRDLHSPSRLPTLFKESVLEALSRGARDRVLQPRSRPDSIGRHSQCPPRPHPRRRRQAARPPPHAPPAAFSAAATKHHGARHHHPGCAGAPVHFMAGVHGWHGGMDC